MLAASARRPAPDRWSVAAPDGAAVLIDLATCVVLVLAIASLVFLSR